MMQKLLKILTQPFTISKIIPVIFLIIIFCSNFITVKAQNVDFSGTSAANFLKVGVGARSMAMGDAATSIVDGPTALYWNVAGITRIENEISFVFSTMDWLVDTRNSYIGAVFKVSSLGSFGLDLQFLNYGNIEETTVFDQDGTGRFFSASDFAFGLSYARQLTDRFSFGIKAKYIREDIANANGDAFALDFGAVFQTTFFNNNLRLAATLSNFGTKMKFEGRDLAVTYTVPGNPSGKQIPAELTTLEWEIPLLFRFGISNYFVNNEDWVFLAAFDVMDSRDYSVRYNLGGEIGFSQTVYLRGGYKFNYDEVTYTAGLGLDFSRILDVKVVLDYLYLNYDVFGNFNEFTLRIDL
jgi:Type IX secretion system protein PorV